MKIFLKDAVFVFEIPKSLIYHELNKKKANVSPFNISGFFFNSSKFKKNDQTQSSFVKDFMLFVVKWLLPTWSPFGYNKWHTCCLHKLSSHPKKHLLRKSCRIWSKRPWIHMWFLHWLIVYQPLVHLTSRCLKECMMSLLLLSTSFQVTRRQNMWHYWIIWSDRH